MKLYKRLQMLLLLHWLAQKMVKLCHFQKLKMTYFQVVQWVRELLLNQVIGVLHAPADGKIIMTFKTGHAIGMKTKNGAEILMHIGMDTVNLQGKGFDTLVEKDQKVKAGDPLIKFDIDLIKKAGYPVTTPMVVTNSQDFDDIKQDC